MKKSTLILLLGLLVSVGAFSAFYYFGTASYRDLMRQPNPGLAWLKTEFHLSDAEFNRVSQMHEAYLPQCHERCMRIAEQNQRLEQMLGTAKAMSPELQNLFLERARTRAECEAEMMKHFLEVSQTMSPEQGKRYLAWVEEQTFLSGQGMEASPGMKMDASMAHEHHM